MIRPRWGRHPGRRGRRPPRRQALPRVRLRPLSRVSPRYPVARLFRRPRRHSLRPRCPPHHRRCAHRREGRRPRHHRGRPRVPRSQPVRLAPNCRALHRPAMGPFRRRPHARRRRQHRRRPAV